MIQHADIQSHCLQLPILRLQHNETCLQAITFVFQTKPYYPVNTTLANKFRQWLYLYERDPTTPCELALQPPPNQFQLRLRQTLHNSQSGDIITYGDLAKRLSTSPRALAQGCRANPLPIVIPCHRVVSKNHWGGYAGGMKGNRLDIKKQLIQHEWNHAQQH